MAKKNETPETVKRSFKIKKTLKTNTEDGSLKTYNTGDKFEHDNDDVINYLTGNGTIVEDIAPKTEEIAEAADVADEKINEKN